MLNINAYEEVDIKASFNTLGLYAPTSK